MGDFRAYFVEDPLQDLSSNFISITVGWQEFTSALQLSTFLHFNSCRFGYHSTREAAIASLQESLRKTRKRCSEILNSIVTDKHLDVEEAQVWASENGWDWSYRHQGWDWPSAFVRDEKVSVIWWDNGWAPSVKPIGVMDNASYGSAIAAMKMADELFPRER